MTAPPRWLLSFHEDTNANAALFERGRPVFAVAEGRLTRRKFQAGFPERSLQACLDFAGIRLDAVDVIVPANKHHFLPRVDARTLPATEHDYFGPLHKAWLLAQHRFARGGLESLAAGRLSRTLLQRRFARLVDFVDHHEAHAASAWLTSGWDHALALTADNMGDGWSAKVFDCETHGGTGGPAQSKMTFLYGSTALHSPGQFYGEIAQLLGFHNLMAGKVTGLAAHGDPTVAYPLMTQLFALDRHRERFVTPPLWRHRRDAEPWASLAKLPREHVAAAAQRRLEDVIVDWAREALRRTGKRRLVLAGGIFANVVVNERLLALPEVDDVWIHPAMTDQGIAMGAGLAWLARNGFAVNAPLPSLYLGPGYGEETMRAALEQAASAGHIVYERPGDITETAARALADRQVVARFDGRLEYGPRALGNRSILYRADEPDVNRWLNERLNRTEFMPFAPMTLAGYEDERFVMPAGGRDAARYMTMTFPVTDRLKDESPGVVHVDHTARPQILRREDNPGMWAILERFRELTGVPTVVNTSFNMHGEPIVCSPQDAVRAFVAGRLDRLILGPWWVARRR